MNQESTAAAALWLGARAERGGTRFALFSDRARDVFVRILGPDGAEKTRSRLDEVGDGLYSVFVPGAGPGALYELLLDGQAHPDPFARFLPRGVHGAAEVIASDFEWKNGFGVERPLREQIIYELHVGTFTREGTYDAARSRLPELRELGVTTLELMPLAAFAGKRGWGYDGVALFAPHAPYGRPSDLCRFIDEAHGLGFMVLLDVVYNHFGPAGNYLPVYSSTYFRADANNPWGQKPDFTRSAMRRLVLQNVRYWLEELRFDGLRLDATHAIDDPSTPHILEEIAATAHELSPRKLVIAEDERNDAELVRRYGLDGVWADDFHHVAHVTATGESDGYYACYVPGTEPMRETLLGGWLYQGQRYPTTGLPRGTSAKDLCAESFIYALQNHDQIGNRPFGERLVHLIGPEGVAGLGALLLFLPMTPLLFMGEEWGASSPFLYFTDHDAELGRLVREGRRREFSAFRGFSPSDVNSLPDPQDESTFVRSQLDWSERERPPHARLLALYKRLIGLRTSDPVLRHGDRRALEVSARGAALVCRRRFGDEARVLVLNLGKEALPWDEVKALLGGGQILLRTDAEEVDRPAALHPLAALLAK